MQDTLNQFISQNTGIANVGDTDVNKGQCVGLIEVWLDTLNLNTPHLYGNAKDLLANADTSKFDVIQNTPNNVPQVGDIIVWGDTWGNGDGHTGIFCSGDVNSFNCFEQNDPTGSTPHAKTYSYDGVIGWLHPLNPSIVTTNCLVPNTPEWQAKYQELVSKATNSDNFAAAGYNSIDDVLNALKDKETTIQNQAKDLQTCQTNLKQAQDLSTKLNDEDLSTSEQLLEAQHELQPYKDTVNTFKTVLGLSTEATTDDITKAIQDLKASKVKTQPKPTTFWGKLVFLFS